MPGGYGQQPGIILLREGTDTSQGKAQLISNINACGAVVDAVRSTLGPRGMDKLMYDGTKVTISNDGATIMKLLDIVHPAARVLAEISMSQDSEVGDGTTGIQKYTTAALPIPNPLAAITAARPSIMRFELKSFGIAALNNALLEIEIQKLNATNYRVNRIKIAGNTAAIRIQGVHVFVKPLGAAGIGVEDENQGSLWHTLDATAPVFARPATLPTTPLTATPLSTTALAIQMQSAQDAITIGIEAIQ